jgi:hypothetical protein
MAIKFRKRQDEKWPVFDLVPGFIVAHAGIQAGSPTIINSRVTTCCAFKFSFQEKDWSAWNRTEQEAFAVMCFEAGIEYQKKHLEIDKVFKKAWGISK